MTTDAPLLTSGQSARRPLSPFIKLLLWGGGILLGLILLLLLLVGLESWRGQRAWDRCQRELQAQGEKLDLKALVPPEIPDAENFAAIPFFNSLRYRHDQPGSAKAEWPEDYQLAQKEARAPRRGTATPVLTDLAAWQRGFRRVRNGNVNQPLAVTAPANASEEVRAALEVLEGLKVYDPMLAEMRAARQRPHSRFPVEYDHPNPSLILLPHLSTVKGVCSVLQLRTTAEVAAGRSDAAFDDVMLAFHLVDAIKDEPALISQLVRLADFHIALVPVREGLARRVWTGPQLVPLQTRLQQFDFVATAQQAMRAERAFGLATMRALLSGKTPTGDGDGDTVQRYGRLVPSGWLSYEQANYARTIQAMLLPDADIQAHRINPQLVNQQQDKVSQQQDKFEKSLASQWKVIAQHRLFSALLLPALGKTYAKFAYAQTVADQAALACALERYRQAKGEHPPNLEALVPAFIEKLPHDVITGEAMHYRRTADGLFVLWSVGWNLEDDDGIPGKSAGDTQEGDWVWEFPVK